MIEAVVDHDMRKPRRQPELDERGDVDHSERLLLQRSLELHQTLGNSAMGALLAGWQGQFAQRNTLQRSACGPGCACQGCATAGDDRSASTDRDDLQIQRQPDTNVCGVDMTCLPDAKGQIAPPLDLSGLHLGVDADSACTARTVPLKINLGELSGAQGAQPGEHAPPPKVEVPAVPPPIPKPIKIEFGPGSTVPSPSNEPKESLGLSALMAVQTANESGTQLPGTTEILREQQTKLVDEVKKTVEMAKGADLAVKSLKADGQAIRTKVGPQAADYQDAYRAFEKSVRDMKPKVTAIKSAAAKYESAKAASDAKKAQEEAEKHQGEIDKAKADADKALGIGLSVIEGFKSGGMAGGATAVATAATGELATQAKALASETIMKILKPDIEATQKALEAAKAKVKGCKDLEMAKALEAAAFDLQKASEELKNSQADLKDALDKLLEREGLFLQACENNGLNGASKAIMMRREMRTQFGTVMGMIDAFDGAVTGTAGLADKAAKDYEFAIDMCCRARREAEVGFSIAGADRASFGVNALKGWAKNEPGACSSDRTKATNANAEFGKVQDAIRDVLAKLPGGKK